MAPEQRTALRSEIGNDPEGLGYAGKTDPEIADLLNAPARPAVVDVRALDVKRVLILAGKWPGIVLAARAGNPAAVNMTEALAAFDVFDLSQEAHTAAIGAGLDALIADPPALITVAEKTAILALAQGRVSRAAELGLPAVHHLDVAKALR